MNDVQTSMAYERARSVHEALTLLYEAGEEGRPLSGGQSLVPLMNLGMAAPGFLVDVTSIPELHDIRVENDYLYIGAAVTHHQLTVEPLIAAHAPLLARGASHIGSRRIRNRGTIGGSVVHGDPAAELPLCCTVLDAEYRVQSIDDDQWRPARTFSRGYYQTDVRTGELVTCVRIPLRPGFGWGFHEYSRRSGDFALASAAAGVSVRDNRIEQVVIAVTGAADRPLRLESVEKDLAGAALAQTDDRMAGLAAGLQPPDDPFSTGADRARLIEALATRAVRDAVREAQEETEGPSR